LTLAGGPVGPYQVQAAIAAVHARAGTGADTDWPQIASLYRVLVQLMPSPVVHVNYAVAVAEANGPEAGLAVLDDVDDARLVGDHRLYAVRAYLLERSGDRDAALLNYARAATLATNDIHSRYLDEQMRRLAPHDEG
jgi:predicted RNA polymerase sigma factor